MFPSFWAQFHDFFETALYWFASTFNLTAEFAKIRGGLDEFFLGHGKYLRGFISLHPFTFIRRIPRLLIK